MSRRYDMLVRIAEYRKDREDHIQDAANDEWNFDNWYGPKGESEMSASGESNLCGGESEDHFAKRLAATCWKANGGPCKVEVVATYLEDLPNQSYTFDAESPPPGYDPPKGPLHECQCCGALWEEDALDPVEDVAERVAPGESMPSGECPSCGALCHERAA